MLDVSHFKSESDGDLFSKFLVTLASQLGDFTNGCNHDKLRHHNLAELCWPSSNMLFTTSNLTIKSLNPNPKVV